MCDQQFFDISILVVCIVFCNVCIFCSNYGTRKPIQPVYQVCNADYFIIGIKNMAVVIDEMDVGTTFSEVCNGKEI